jgi:radical SAM superfamily enzyme YgiQ (UPF0313 family)
VARPTVLLIAPPVLYAKSWWSARVASKPHLYALAGFIRDVADVRILELDTGADVELDLDGVDLVGISSWTSLHYLGAVEIARKIRALRPELPIVAGGHHATAMPADFVTEEELFDHVVRGDGEHVLRALVLGDRKRPARATVTRGDPVDLRDPSRIDWDNYPWHDEKARGLWICLSRGCPFKCTYCAEPQRGAAWSHYSVADALGVLERLMKTHAPRVIALSDPLFGASRQWTEALLAGIRERGIDCMFWCETRADVMTPKLLDELRASRFKVDFGLDTGSETMARRMVKSPVPATYLRKAKEIIGHANTIELPHDTYALFNYPGETPETARESMDFVEALVPAGGKASGWISSQTFFILPGTEAYARMDEYRAQYGTEIRHPAWWRETGDHNALATDILPSDAFRGREDEKMAFREWQQRVNVERTKFYSTETFTYLRAFYAPGG